MVRTHGDLDTATLPGTDGARVAPGKRSPTDRLQRRAAATPAPTSESPAPRWSDPTLSSTPFADSLLAPVQRHGDGAGDGDDAHAHAAAGTAGSGHALPFLDTIQASFGDHDVSGVQAHTDGAAASAAAGMGATAFATGNHVAFGGAPDLHTAAHEAAHVVQQRAGVSLKGGVSEAGDPYEQHADAVADAVVRGESAQGLLDHGPQGGGGTAIQRRVHGFDAPDNQPDTSKPEVELAKSLAKLAAGMKAAEASMGKGGNEESDAIRTHAQAAASALSDARYHAGRLTKGGEAAKQAALVKRHEAAIDALYAWARKVRVYQAKFSLDRVFDHWDDLLFAVGLDKQARAEKYYADWTVAPNDLDPARAKEGPVTQHDLVEECVRMFDQAATITPLLAISQFETMLSEPVAPPEPALLEKLIKLAGSMLVTYFGGKVAEELGEAVARALKKGDDFKAKVIEKIEGKVDTLAEKVKGEEEGGKPDGGGGSKVKTEFLDKTRLAAFVAMQNGGAALNTYKHELLRREPYEIGKLHAELRAMPPKLWGAAKQKVIFEWLNLKASFDRDHKSGKESNQLDFHVKGRVGEKGRDVLERMGRERGIYKQHIEFGDAHGIALKTGAPQLEDVEDGVKRELVAAAVPMMKLPLHRRIMMTRRDHYHGTPKVIASVYLTADHQLVVEQMDNYVMSKIQRGQSIDGPKNPGKPAGGVGPLGTLPDPMPKSEKEMEDEARLTPSLFDSGTATLGVKKLLDMIKTTTADLGGGD